MADNTLKINISDKINDINHTPDAKFSSLRNIHDGSPTSTRDLRTILSDQLTSTNTLKGDFDLHSMELNKKIHNIEKMHKKLGGGVDSIRSKLQEKRAELDQLCRSFQTSYKEASGNLGVCRFYGRFYTEEKRQQISANLENMQNSLKRISILEKNIDVQALAYVTESGTIVEVLDPNEIGVKPLTDKEEQEIFKKLGFTGKVELVEKPTCAYNYRGYVLLKVKEMREEGWILHREEGDEKLLQEDGYQRAKTPELGDLIVFTLRGTKVKVIGGIVEGVHEGKVCKMSGKILDAGGVYKFHPNLVKDHFGEYEVYHREISLPEAPDCQIEKLEHPARGTFRDFKAHCVIYFPELADDVFKALHSGSAVEIYRHLQPLYREPEGIAKLKEAYRARAIEEKTRQGKKYYDENDLDLVHAIKNRFSNPGQKDQYEHLLYLLGEEGTDQTIGRMASSREENRTDAIRLRQALYHKNGPQCEIIYKILESRQRSTQLLAELNAPYKAQYGTDFPADLQKKLQGEHRDYSLYLIGYQVMEKKVMSENVLPLVWNALGQSTFDRGDGKWKPIPYQDPSGDGCAARKYLTDRILKNMGCWSESAHITSPHAEMNGQKRDNLCIYTDLARDVMPGTDPAVNWGTHTAVCIPVRIGAKIERMVLDWAVSDRPLPFGEWVTIVTKDALKPFPVELISPADFKAKCGQEMANSRMDYLADKISVIITKNNYYDIKVMIESKSSEEPIPGLDSLYTYKNSNIGKRAIKCSVEWIPSITIAKYIREQMRNPGVKSSKDAMNIINGIRRICDNMPDNSKVGSNFSCHFPHLYTSLGDSIRSLPNPEEPFNEFLKLLPDKRNYHNQMMKYVTDHMSKIKDDKTINAFFDHITKTFPSAVHSNFRYFAGSTYEQFRAHVASLPISRSAIRRFVEIMP